MKPMIYLGNVIRRKTMTNEDELRSALKEQEDKFAKVRMTAFNSINDIIKLGQGVRSVESLDPITWHDFKTRNYNHAELRKEITYYENLATCINKQAKKELEELCHQ